MQYIVEDLTPVKKKISISVPADEVGEALAKTLELYRSSITLKGFRRGKAPAAMLERRFHREIYEETASDLIQRNLESALREKTLVPASRFEIKAGDLVRGTDFSCEVTLEVMPEFPLPPHEGLCVEQQQASVEEREMDTVLERLRDNRAEILPVTEARAPVDGDLVLLDFDGYDASGAPLPDISGQDMTVILGRNQVVADFEALIKTLKAGESGEGPVTFPETYFRKELAGKTVTMKIRLVEVNERRLPDPDDAFARTAGPFDSLEEMRRHIRDNFIKSRAEIHKAAARRKLLDTLLEGADFPVPEAMLESNLSLAVAEMRRDLDRFGQSLDGFVPDPERDLREEARPEALRRTREQIILLAVARAHDLAVSDGELDLHLHRMARQDERDYASALESYRKNGALLQVVRERLLEDKALDFVYDKAVITMLPPDEAARREIPPFAATEEGKGAAAVSPGDRAVLTEAAPSPAEAALPEETASCAGGDALSPTAPSPAEETG